MASKQAKSESKSPDTARANGQPVFINYDMTDDTKKMFKAWAHENAVNIFDLIDKLTEEGINVSIKWDTYNHCFGCYLVPTGSAKRNIGFILTGRGSSSFGALAGALYRHYVIFEGTWDTDDYRRYGLDDE